MSDTETVRRTAGAFADSIDALARNGDLGDIADDVLQQVFTAAVRAYAARVDKTEREPEIVDVRLVNATEGVTAACALIRAINLNMFDVTLWYNRSGPNR